MKKLLSLLASAAITFSAAPLSEAAAEDVGGFVLSYTIEDKQATVTGCAGSDAILIIPAELEGCPVTAVADDAFSGNNDIGVCVIPDSVKTIGNGSFRYCDSLESVTLSSALTSIGNYAFEYDEKLKEITIPDTVKTIGDSAFSNCISLKKAVLPAKLTAIPNSLFNGCEKLQNVALPETLETIGSDAFARCSSITAVDIPKSVKKISGSAFSGCNSLSEISISGLLTNIESYAFYVDEGTILSRTLTFKDDTEEITYDMISPFRENITNIVIPDTVKEIGESAFSYCTKLEEAVLPESVTLIGNGIFVIAGVNIADTQDQLCFF